MIQNFPPFFPRNVITPTDLGRFDSMVVPLEMEAYGALKSRTGEEICKNCIYHLYLYWVYLYCG